MRQLTLQEVGHISGGDGTPVTSLTEYQVVQLAAGGFAGYFGWNAGLNLVTKGGTFAKLGGIDFGKGAVGLLFMGIFALGGWYGSKLFLENVVDPLNS